MDDLIADFIAETHDMLAALSGAVVAWEAAPSDRSRLDEIFRFVHTVKGNCGFFDLPRIETLSHAAESVLAEVRDGRRAADAALVTAVLGVVDRVGILVEALETEAAVPEDDAALIAALRPTANMAATTSPQSVPSAPPAPERQPLRSIRLSVDLLDRLMSGVSDMVLARNELARRLRDAGSDPEVDLAFARVSNCIAETRDAITRTRMQRVENLFVGLPRLVRDLAAELGKDVTIEVNGGDVELDREMIEMIRDPLTHIVRNAVDHGIEPAEARLAGGKQATGRVHVCAHQSGNQILIEVGDDGAGIDGDKLVARALKQGSLTQSQADRLSPAQRAALIFEAGLSTAAAVTSISGRGVGMDVVRANIERIGGIVELDNRPGVGLRLTLRVPLTLTLISVLTISTAGCRYAIPRAAIEEIVHARNAAIRMKPLGGDRVVTLRGRHLPLVDLSEVLGTDLDHPVEGRHLIVLKAAGGETYALLVDRVHDHEEVVVKPAAPVIMATGLYAGTTLADDGCPILLLDASGIASSAGIVTGADRVSVQDDAVAPTSAEAIPALLFRGIGGERQAIRLGAITRIEELKPGAVVHAGGRLHARIGDSILPLIGCGAEVPEGGLRVLRLSDGAREIAYAIAEVLDMVTLDGDLQTAAGAGAAATVALVAGEPAEVVEPYWLFAAEAQPQAPRDQRPLCALAGADAWAQNVLRPLVEAAGYRVARFGSADADGADLIVATEDHPIDAADPSAVLRIRSSPDRVDAADDSVYRYDHAALLEALGRHSGTPRKARA